jgi:putative oxidoreductase
VTKIVREHANVLGFTILRIGAGSILILHGLSQLMGGEDSLAQSALTQLGVSAAPMTGYLIIYLELIGGICVVAGLFTRAFASALAVEMLWVASVFWSYPHVMSHSTSSVGGYELWGFP